MQHCNENWQAGTTGRDETSEAVTPLLPCSPTLFLCTSENKWTAKGREVPKIASLECTSMALLLPVIASLRGNWSYSRPFFTAKTVHHANMVSSTSKSCPISKARQC